MCVHNIHRFVSFEKMCYFRVLFNWLRIEKYMSPYLALWNGPCKLGGGVNYARTTDLCAFLNVKYQKKKASSSKGALFSSPPFLLPLCPPPLFAFCQFFTHGTGQRYHIIQNQGRIKEIEFCQFSFREMYNFKIGVHSYWDCWHKLWYTYYSESDVRAHF